MKSDDDVLETFQQYLLRRRTPGVKAPKLSWDSRNRGEGLRSLGGHGHSLNDRKRRLRAAYKIDRLAHIRWFREHGVPFHVPKMKRVPAFVFE